MSDVDEIAKEMRAAAETLMAVESRSVETKCADLLAVLVDRDALKTKLAEAEQERDEAREAYTSIHMDGFYKGRDRMKDSCEFALLAADSLQAERDALKARVAALEKAAVTAIIPLEAMNLVGLDGRFPPEVAKGIREGIEAVRAVLAELDADQPKGNAHDDA